jgi:hypothetical protein
VIVQYDLSRDIASTDFYSWLCRAAAEGATEIVFNISNGYKTNKWPEDRVKRRLRTLLMPGPAFLELPCRIGTDGVRTEFAPTAHQLQQFCLNGGQFPRLETVLQPGTARYTVTMRRDARIPEKNSNEKAWRQFAAEIDAVVIEDYDVCSMHPFDIMALYAGAEMNFGVNSGQFWLCALSPYPYMVFDTCDQGEHPDPSHRGSMKFYFPKNGLPVGEKWAWFNEHQHVIWEPDRIEVLRNWFMRWKPQ